jgi:hypothetical protein
MKEMLKKVREVIETHDEKEQKKEELVEAYLQKYRETLDIKIFAELDEKIAELENDPKYAKLEEEVDNSICELTQKEAEIDFSKYKHVGCNEFIQILLAISNILKNKEYNLIRNMGIILAEAVDLLIDKGFTLTEILESEEFARALKIAEAVEQKEDDEVAGTYKVVTIATKDIDLSLEQILEKAFVKLKLGTPVEENEEFEKALEVISEGDSIFNAIQRLNFYKKDFGFDLDLVTLAD